MAALFAASHPEHGHGARAVQPDAPRDRRRRLAVGRGPGRPRGHDADHAAALGRRHLHLLPRGRAWSTTTSSSEWAGRLERYAVRARRRACRRCGRWARTTCARCCRSINVPTLVMRRRDERWLDPRHARVRRRERPRREAGGAARHRRARAGGRRERGGRRAGGVRHRHPPLVLAGARAGDGPVHRHRRLHPARGRDGRRALEGAARGALRDRPRAARALRRPRGQDDGRRLPGHLRRAGARRSAARSRSPRRRATSAWTCAPACTRASATSPATTSAASPCTSPRA